IAAGAVAGLGAASAKDVPYTLHVNGRPLLPSDTPVALQHDGVVFIDIARATKIFDGLVTFSKTGARLSVENGPTGQTSTADFHFGSTTATIAGTKVKLSGAPFRLDGVTYVPLSTIVRMGGGTVSLDSANHIARVSVRPRPPVISTPSPQVSLSSVGGGSLQPSLGQSLALVPSGTIDAAGLHVRVEVANNTGAAVVATFPTSAQIAFAVSRNGDEVWNSTAGHMYAQVVTTVTFEAHASKTYSDVWPGFAKAGPGRYALRATLLTQTPLVSPPVSLGVSAPSPTSS
ncbi:MAG TPA: BsuPI-related putative proteinase inhibitor, partial [Candidatus Baltobacteraceae bacterium]|nr:BsuPI-related putative proteinase inhibitor [Candidatus Baltobacteraceae bacterium]